VLRRMPASCQEVRRKGIMKRVTVSLPDDLASGIDEYLKAQDHPPTLDELLQAALREFLRRRGFLKR
jgi:metal-responsive CopG/Arc/MetJ family transcriptional regulator